MSRLKFSASAIVRNEAGHFLLIKREDLRIWTPPGGQVDYGETIEEAARREAFEETGVEVAIDKLHGIYRFEFSRKTTLNFVYNAHPIGGKPTPSIESIDVRYFSPDALPDRMHAIARQRIDNVLAGRYGILVDQPIIAWQRVAVAWLFRLRDWRNRYLLRRPTPPQSFYRAFFQAQVDGEIVETLEASEREVPWIRLQACAEKQIGRSLSNPRVVDVQTDIEGRAATIIVAFD